ncbi:MAG: HEAT repeat domain-containing protein [Planctomycetota bacterium]
MSGWSNGRVLLIAAFCTAAGFGGGYVASPGPARPVGPASAAGATQPADSAQPDRAIASRAPIEPTPTTPAEAQAGTDRTPLRADPPSQPDPATAPSPPAERIPATPPPVTATPSDADRAAAMARAASRFGDDVCRRAELNGIPPEIQDRVDHGGPSGSIWLSGSFFDDIRRTHDISRALLGRLTNRPFEGIATDIAKLPDAQLSSIVDAVLQLANEGANPLARVEATHLLGLISLPRLEWTNEQGLSDTIGRRSLAPDEYAIAWSYMPGDRTTIRELATPFNYVSDLTRLAGSPHPAAVRLAAMTMLVEFNDPGAAGLLRAMLDDDIAESVRYSARLLLKRIDPDFR